MVGREVDEASLKVLFSFILILDRLQNNSKEEGESTRNGIRCKEEFFLYSVGTRLAYKIAKRYYNNTHFVWCSTKFNMLQQPPTSNPATICKRYLEQITTGDRHSVEIKNNIAGILKGAKAKLDSGVIGKREFKK